MNKVVWQCPECGQKDYERLPTFDEWHTENYGPKAGQRFEDVVTAMGEYITEMVRCSV